MKALILPKPSTGKPNPAQARRSPQKIRRSVPFYKFLPWQNWGKTVECKPEYSFFPEDVEDLQSVVQLAAETGKKLRVVAQGHAWSGLVLSKDILVYIHQLDKVEMDFSDPDQAVVVVESGADVRNVNDVLERHGYALPSNVVLESVRWGGLVATGSHGSGWKEQTLSDMVKWIEIVDAKGRLRRFEEGVDSKEVMNAARLHLGMFGITYRMALKVQSSWRVLARDREISMETALNRMRELVFTHDSLDFFWWAFTDKVWVKSWDKTDQPITAKPRKSKWEGTWSHITSKLMMVLFFLMKQFPKITPALSRFAYRFVPSNGEKVVDIVEAIHYRRAIEVLKMGCVEIAFKIDPDFENVKQAFQLVVDKTNAYAAKGQYPMNMTVNLRFINNSDCLLSPASGPGHTCYIEILGNADQGLWESFSAEIAQEWLKLPGAKPHWAKEFQHIPGILPYLKKVYEEEIEEFNAVKDALKMDPNGMFLNPLLKELFTP